MAVEKQHSDAKTIQQFALIPYPRVMTLQVLVGVLAAYHTLSNEKDIKTVVESEGDKILVFGVQWCGHCKKFEYVAHELV